MGVTIYRCKLLCSGSACNTRHTIVRLATVDFAEFSFSVVASLVDHENPPANSR